MINTQYITLNMVTSGVMPVLYCSQYDIGRPLGVVVYDSNASVDLDTYTVTIEATRTDGTAITAAVTTDDNVGAFETTATMTNVADKYDAQLVLVDDGGNRVASLPFIMCVVEASMDENAESIQEDMSLYYQYTYSVQRLIADIKADLTEETYRASAAESTLQSNIDAEAATRAAADTAEATTRATADTSLQSQINTFTALTNGSTTGDAELTNIRVSADGMTYDTAGDAVRGQIGTLTDTVKGVFIPTVTSINRWVQGSITVEGNASDSPYKVRSGGFITFDTDYPRVTVVVPNGMKISYREYSQEGTYAEYLVSGSDWSEGSLSLSVSASYFYRFVLAYTNSTNITPSDVSDDTVYYTTYAATDTTLTQSGKAADAKVTGEYIDSLANAGNLINNALIPSVADLTSRPKIGNTGYFYKYDKERLSVAEHGIKMTNNGGPRVCGAFVSSGTDFDNAGLAVETNYTISFDLEYKLLSNDATSGTTRYLYLYLCEADENTDLVEYNLIDTSRASDYLLIATLEDADKGVVKSTRVEWTFALASTTKHFSLTIKSTALTGGYATGTDYITLENLMLQKGTYATAWDPSYGDMFAYIDNFNQEKSVVGRNDKVDMTVKLQQLNRATRTGSTTFGPAPLCLLWFSDIHSDANCLQNVITFKTEYSDYIRDIIHTGDTVLSTSADGITFWDSVDGSENILNVIGNHDTRVGTTWIGQTMAESYNMYFAPYIDNWNVTYTAGLTYYYKDYAVPGVRLIVLDIMHQTTAQLTWFASTLEGARTNGYHVIVAVHSRAHWLFDPYDTPWDDKALVPSYTAGYSDTSASSYPENLSNDYADAVDDFITAGGEFICWIHGHTHFKMFAKIQTHTNQLDVAVANAAGASYARTYVWARVIDSRSEDDFNLLAIDTESKILRLAKVGVNYDRYMRHVDTISYDYGNRVLLYSN